MKKASRRSTHSCAWMALLCLISCGPSSPCQVPFGDYFYSVPVEVHLSEPFLKAWNAGYPLRVKAHFESHPAKSGTTEGPNPPDDDVGVVCLPPASGPVRLQRLYPGDGCVPKDMSVTVSIVPAPELAQSACAVLPDGGTTDGGTTSPPPKEPAPEVNQTVQAKILDCANTDTVVFDF